MPVEYPCLRCGQVRLSYADRCDFCGLKPFGREPKDEIDAVRCRRDQIHQLARESATLSSIALAFVGALVLWFVAIATNEEFLPCAMTAAFLIGVVSWNYFRSRRHSYRGDRVVLWARRFGRDRRTTAVFARILRDASAGVAVPITIQDSTVRLSVELGWARVFSGRVGESVVSIATFAIMIPWFAAAIVLPHGIQLAARIMIVIATITGAMVIVLRAGYFKVSDDDPVGSTSGILSQATTVTYERLRDRLTLGRILYNVLAGWLVKLIVNIVQLRDRANEATLRGIVVLKCADRTWRSVVETCFQTVAAVVIDLTDISENIQWELERAVEIVGTRSVIIAVPVDSQGNYLSVAVATFIKNNALASVCTMFHYPGQLGDSLGRLRQKRRELVEKLERILDVALAESTVRLRQRMGASAVDRYVARYRKLNIYTPVA